jgi:hypothetical protein
MSKKIISFLLICCFSLFAESAFALDYFKGTKAMGMGGARVASTDSTRAQYYNPAAFGFMGLMEKNRASINASKYQKKDSDTEEFVRFDVDNNNLGRKDWGMGILDFGLRARILEEEFVDILQDFEDVFDKEDIEGATEIKSIIRLTDFVNRAQNLNDKQILSTDISVNAGNFRTGNFAVGLDFSACTAFKLENFDIDTSAYSFNQEAKDSLGSVDNVDSSYTIQYLSDAQKNTLTGTDYNFSDDEVGEIDYLIGDQIREGNVEAGDVNGLVEQLIELTEDTGASGTEDANEIVEGTITANTFWVAEFPVSYGYAFNKYLSVGGNFKIMVGEEREDRLIFEEGTDRTEEESKQSTTFGIDVGVMGRMEKFNFGFMARNLNTPQFDKINSGDIELKPQVCIGAAFIPFQNLTIEADIDLTENESYEGYETQNISVGAEFDTRLLALRGGIVKNLSAKQGSGISYSAGVGLNVWLLRLDFGLSFTQNFVTYDDTDIPEELQIGLNVEMDF